ncbi:MAG: hypothetical protein HYS41_02705 [Candidatus Omnitrophica bacterium]|nr:hypothetical protein [Candidatus Omnitrophota bacterium]
MIKINLLPPDVRRTRRGPGVKVPWKAVGIGAGVCLLVYSGALFFFNQAQNRTLSRLTSEWQGLEPERARLEQRKQALLNLKNRASAVTSMKSPDAKWAPRLNLLSDALVRNLWFTALVGVKTPKSETMGFLQSELKDFVPGQIPGFSEQGELLGLSPNTPEAGGGAAQPAAEEKFLVVLAGVALVEGKESAAPVTRFLQRLKEHPDFSKWFTGVELKDVFHQQVGKEETSAFVILLYPTGN